MPFIRKGVLLKDWQIKLRLMSIPTAAFLLGYFIDEMNQERYKSYYNKSALFGGRTLKPGESHW